MLDVILKRLESPVPAEPHDSWVVGNEPYVSLHFLGAEDYAKR